METKGTDEVEKLKSKFMSAWHNVKYSWALKTKTAFSRNSPVFLLGKCYHFKAVDDESPTESSTADALDDDVVVMGNVDGFRRDFTSRVWLTYREELPALPGSTLTSDCGWGCTLRAGQMVLSQALLLHILGRDWTWAEALTLEPLDTETWTSSAARKLVATLEASVQGERAQVTQPHCSSQGRAEEADSYLKEAYHRTIVSWFGDGPLAQLGIHRLVQLGLTSGKQAGDWYGPAVVAHILRKAVDGATDPMLKGLSVYVAQDCTVYSADVIDSHLGQTGSHSNPQGLNTGAAPGSRAVIILIPVRLGGEKINTEYFSFVKSILSLEYCIGIIGGKPKQAYYFVGFQDDSLIYLDPHYCQSFVDVSTSNFPLQSYHCPSPKKMAFNKMDPSCTIGFYSKNIEHYERISSQLSKILQPSSKEKYPAFTFMKGHGKDYELSVSVEKREWPFIKDTRKAGATSGDFVLL
ncbi:cysteine protease ATG4C-like isoform X1 [Myxocyprinus asiaticus]|uniref:cysteine protease ATG4C-like isoform X1 n=2 Tax=Myxocyprinus asiaticus TaxID=70543 RepID=UPI0022212D39|nr:cysteine protease ATG4C-like isoform X1 [Myxocyprinus asiaticus]XP_051562126.1 cysteine protease ATG4C-like isoform X1 [Myxocyprinus asiaticus]XP_051562127.1 cysteine protease ATG4C-like isoform X1 [Myxocyprinus asiaticus]XP_051562128.1 cysteine protease ATG4C-like isoform X1 [Myxocyprinus asiaticus]